MANFFESFLLGLVWFSLILNVVCDFKERKARRTKSLLWGKAIGSVGATLAFALLSVFYTHGDLPLQAIYTGVALLWATSATMDVEKLFRQLTMTPSMYGMSPSDSEAMEQFDKDAVEAWKLLREEYPS